MLYRKAEADHVNNKYSEIWAILRKNSFLSWILSFVPKSGAMYEIVRS